MASRRPWPTREGCPSLRSEADDDRAADGGREVLCGLAAALPLSLLLWGAVAVVVSVLR